MLRTCKKCGETKEIGDFKKNKKCKYGHTYVCKKCDNIYNKDHPPIIIKKRLYSEYHKIYYQAHKKEKREYYKKWRRLPEKKDIIKQYIKTSYNNCKEKRKEDTRNYKKHNPLKVKQWNRNRSITLSNATIKAMIKHVSNIDYGLLELHPELIEAKRIQIQLLRLTKNKENEKCN